jgi:adenine-specific DNA-methyltransferase
MAKLNKTRDVTTQGIKYTGSKLKLLPYIIEIISALDVVSVLDGFSGTTRVSQALAQNGYQVTSSDISVWSEVFGKCFLQAKKEKEFYQKYIDELNSLKGSAGWFTTNYSKESGLLSKAPFQRKNLMKLDSIREKIESYELNSIDKSVLLTSLIFALDKVDSTIGHFASYLADWSQRSYKDLFLEVPKYTIFNQTNNVIRDDIFNVVKNMSFDLAYFDPPYGSNNEKMPPSRVRYASYYHFWTSVILYDKPALFGKVQRREDTRDTIASSVFEEFKKNENGKHIATEAIRQLIKQTNAKYILFSYSNGGRATKEELDDIFNSSGNLIKVVEIDYKLNIMSTMKWTNEWLNAEKKNVEYLFLLKKTIETD